MDKKRVLLIVTIILVIFILILIFCIFAIKRQISQENELPIEEREEGRNRI